MADICVIYAQEDEDIVRKLVSLLRNKWNVWWAEDIAQGDWEQVVRSQIRTSMAVIPVISSRTESKNIFKDELKYAEKQGRLIFPFFIELAELPLGFGHLNHTHAIGWKGAVNDPSYQQLIKKIAAKLGMSDYEDRNLKRISTIELRGKTLQLPCFVYSLSSHETQVPPKDGVKLFQLLEPAAGLISAYDAWKYYKRDRAFLSTIKILRKSNCTLFLDSGNYEASRKNDHYSKNNKNGWHRDCFRQIANELSPDIAFAFDETRPKGTIDQVAERIVKNFHADKRAICSDDFPLCPIVHLPEKYNETVAECASTIVARVALILDPVMIAIPERELGDGLVERFRTVKEIRNALNRLGKYYPLHLLGTGNPISIIALAAAGADSFDGLEWCRTVVDYDNGNLFHFQHFDCFRERYLTRLQSDICKSIIQNPEASYCARVASYNMDFFTDWTKTMQNMIRSGQIEFLLRLVPNIGTTLIKEFSK